MVKSAKGKIIIPVATVAFVLAAAVIFCIYYANKIEKDDNYTIIYNGRTYISNGERAYISNRAETKFAGLTTWVPLGVLNPVYAEKADIPGFLLYGYRGSEGCMVYWLEGSQGKFDTDFASFELYAGSQAPWKDTPIFTTTDTFLLCDQIGANPEYSIYHGTSLSEEGLTEFGCLRGLYKAPENCSRYISIFEKDKSYYLRYFNMDIDIPSEYYRIDPNSQLMDLVEMIENPDIIS